MTSATMNGVTTTFAYRGDGLRDSRTTGGVTTTFTRDVAAGLPAVLDDCNQYVYGADLTAMKQSGSWYYYLADGLGSTMAIVDGSGAIQKSYTYDVYGKPTATGTLANEVDFAGQQTDATGLQYLRARYVDPAAGTFASREPMASGPGWTLSSFGYGAANPVRFSDPDGLWPGERLAKKVKHAAGKVADAVGEGAATVWADRNAIIGQCAAWGASGLVYGAVTGGLAGAAAGALAGCAMGAASQLISHVENPLIAGSLECGTWFVGTALGGGGALAAGAACAAGIAGVLAGGQGNQCAIWATAGLIAGAEVLAAGGRSGLPAMGAAGGCAAAAFTSGPPKVSATGYGGEKGGT